MKNLKFLFITLSLMTVFTSSVFAQYQNDIAIPEEEEQLEEKFIPPHGTESEIPVILDESDANDVSDVEEYEA